MSNDLSSGTADGGDDDFCRLIRDARGGCTDAMRQVVEACRPYLLAVADNELESHFLPKVGASDVVQEALISAERCFSDFRGDDRADLLAWLKGILHNDLLETRRRFRTAGRNIDREQPVHRQMAASVVDPGITPTSEAIAGEESQLLHEALSRLDSEARAIIEMRNWQQLSFAEIGAQTGRSEDAARKFWSRAILKLQQELETIRDAALQREIGRPPDFS